jgi:hypothetical protein
LTPYLKWKKNQHGVFGSLSYRQQFCYGLQLSFNSKNAHELEAPQQAFESLDGSAPDGIVPN